MAARTTPVADWLKKNDWTQYAPQFDAKGYKVVEDLGTDKQATAAIDSIVPDTLPGVRNSMFRSWQQQVADDKTDPPAPAPPDIPKLPPGKTFDLSATSISVSGVEYKLPTALGTAGGTYDKPVLATELTNEQWMVIAKRRELLHGVRMDLALAGNPSRADLSALDWMVPATTDFVQSETTSKATGTLDFTNSTSDARRQQIIDASASGQYAYCAASLQASQDMKEAAARLDKKLYMTGYWWFPRAILLLDQCVQASPGFIAAVKTALASGTADQQADALQKVFDNYGHVYYRRLTLGGTLYFQSTTETTVQVNERKVTDTISTAVGVKAGDPKRGTGGGASASFQIGTGTANT